MILVLKEVNTFYGTSHVLQDISLEVAPAEVVALLGRNGVGKTTTLRSIIGLTPPKSGSIVFNGEEVQGRPAYALASMGMAYMPDDLRIFPDLTCGFCEFNGSSQPFSEEDQVFSFNRSTLG